MDEYRVISYTVEINGESFGERMYPISTIIEALQLYYKKYDGIVGALNGKTRVEDIVNKMIL